MAIKTERGLSPRHFAPGFCSFMFVLARAVSLYLFSCVSGTCFVLFLCFWLSVLVRLFAWERIFSEMTLLGVVCRVILFVTLC